MYAYYHSFWRAEVNRLKSKVGIAKQLQVSSYASLKFESLGKS